jgi:peptidoglycan/xylan/chitin deacetylase (PgdA/CDA1 family)
MSHTLLTQISASEASRELAQSRTEIEDQLGKPCELFAYPNGNVNPEVRRAVEAAGYRLAFTTKPGRWKALTDPYLIPRVNISENHLVGPGGKFSAITLQYSLFWKCRRRSTVQ